MRLVGGEFLLNLTALSLDLTAGEVSISNEEVLSQLLELRNFIDEKRDFTKGFKDLKPVLVQYRSSASKIDGVVPCSLSFNTDALHLSIAGYSVQADGSPITLRINVVYEWTDYVGYTIKTAKLKATNVFNALSITGDEIVENMTGYSYSKSDVPATVTVNYAGVCKNGNKITFVIAGKVRNITGFSTRLGDFYMPSSIGENLVPFNVDNDISVKSVFMAKDSGYGAGAEKTVTTRKPSDTRLVIYLFGASDLDADTDYYFRYEETFLLSENLAPAGE